MFTVKQLEDLITRVKAAGEVRAREMRELKRPDGSAIFAPAEEEERRAKIEGKYRATLAEARTTSGAASTQIAAQRAALAQRASVSAADFSQADMPVALGYLTLLADDIGSPPLADAAHVVATIANGSENTLLKRAALRIAQRRADRLGDEPLDPAARASFLEAVGTLTSRVHPTLGAEHKELATLEETATQLGIAAAFAAHMGRYER